MKFLYHRHLLSKIEVIIFKNKLAVKNQNLGIMGASVLECGKLEGLLKICTMTSIFFNLFINSVGRDKQGSDYICRQYQIP